MATLLSKRFEVNASTFLSVRLTKTSGAPYDLDDAVLQIREEEDSEEVIVTASVENGMITIEPVADEDDPTDPGGWANVIIPPSAWEGVDYFGGAVYDLVVTRTADGETKRLVEGPAIISRGVTRV